MSVIDFLAETIADGTGGYSQHLAAELIERMTPAEWDCLTTDMVRLISSKLERRKQHIVQTKRKGGCKSIAGRRNRCHAAPALVLYKEHVQYDPDTRLKIERMLIDSCNGSGLYRLMTMNQADVEVIVPNKFKQPRFLS